MKEIMWENSRIGQL